uniref:Uncharacterized protein n=1 Tax=Anopheles arabiensis TaxID=7173 RepID=A0A182IHT6_ANOAR
MVQIKCLCWWRKYYSRQRLEHAIDIFQTKYKHDNRIEGFPF